MKSHRINGKKRVSTTDMRPSPPTRILAALLILAAASTLQAQRTLTVGEQYLLAAANQERAARGIPELRIDPTLVKAASYHAHEMAIHAGISHQFPGEPELATRGAEAGTHFSLITENVAEAPSAVVIHDLWMKSPGHRANLLDPHVNVIGIAIVNRDNQLYAVEDFARTVETLSLNEQESAVASLLTQSGLQLTNTTTDARKTCAMSTGYAGHRQPWFIMRYTAANLNEIPSQLKTRLSTGKYHQAAVGACTDPANGPFTAYNIAVLLFP